MVPVSRAVLVGWKVTLNSLLGALHADHQADYDEILGIIEAIDEVLYSKDVE